MDTHVRINKFLSENGICSRREADKLIESGKVYVNGRIPEVGTKVSLDDEIVVNGTTVNLRPKLVYLALNKPKGIISTTEKKVKENIVDFVNFKDRVFPIGRLDKDSEGLILLTNDGDIVNKILRSKNNHEKEYIVNVNKEITKEFLEKMSNGVRILDTITKKCFVKRINSFTFKIILTQGLNRQIRRMCEELNYKVVGLKRIRIMNIKLDDLPTGKWRHLYNDEIKNLNKLLSNSDGNL